MKKCFHYEEKDGKYVSTVRKIKKHVFCCKNCKMKLHDVDVVNLNNYINAMNVNPDSDMMDIYEMLKPVPYEYHTDNEPVKNCSNCPYKCIYRGIRRII